MCVHRYPQGTVLGSQSGRSRTAIFICSKRNAVFSLRDSLIYCVQCLIASLSQAYGTAGVVKIVRILEREIVTGMQLIGARTVHDLVPEMVRRRPIPLIPNFMPIIDCGLPSAFQIERVDWQPLVENMAKL